MASDFRGQVPSAGLVLGTMLILDLEWITDTVDPSAQTLVNRTDAAIPVSEPDSSPCISHAALLWLLFLATLQGGERAVTAAAMSPTLCIRP